METAENRHRVRRAFSILLIVIAAVLAPLVVTSGWAITTVTNTNRFVSTMSALGTNPTVINYEATEGAKAVVGNIDLTKRIESKIPGPVGQYIAPLLATQAEAQLTKAFTAVLASPKFQAAWTAKLRLVHATFVKLMTTDPSKLQHASQLALDYAPQVVAAINQLDKRGITVFDPLKATLGGNKRVLVSLAQGKQFKEVQWYFHIAVQLRWILPVLLVVIAAIGVLLDPRRRRAGIWLSLGIAISCLVMLLLLAFGKQYFISHAPTPQDVANVLFSTLTSFLRWELRIAVLVGGLAALVLWATGPSARATSLRRAVAAGTSKAARKAGDVVGEERAGRVESGAMDAFGFLGRHARAFIWSGVTIALLAAVLWVDTLGGLVWTVVLTALWVIAFVAVRRGFSEEANPPPPAVTA